MGKSTISMAIFNPFSIAMLNYQRVNLHFSMVFLWFSHHVISLCPGHPSKPSASPAPASPALPRRPRRRPAIWAAAKALDLCRSEAMINSVYIAIYLIDLFTYHVYIYICIYIYMCIYLWYLYMCVSYIYNMYVLYIYIERSYLHVYIYI